MTHKITEPLRLARGSHQPGSGAGCVMNVISWENGDDVITDFPQCADGVLSRLVQFVNDEICTEHASYLCVDTGQTHADIHEVQACRENSGIGWDNLNKGRHISLLCPEHSQQILDLGHSIVGTRLSGATFGRIHTGWVRICRAVGEYPGDSPAGNVLNRCMETVIDSPARAIPFITQVVAAFKEEFAEFLPSKFEMPRTLDAAIRLVQVRAPGATRSEVEAVVDILG